MCSLKVAILTAVLLQVKAFVFYPCHYDQEVLPGEVQMFFKALEKVLTLQICLYWAADTCPHSYCPETPNARVKYVAHRASCLLYGPLSYPGDSEDSD